MFIKTEYTIAYVTNYLFFVLVTFRFVVFRPFVEEVLTGRIRSCDHEGVHGKA